MTELEHAHRRLAEIKAKYTKASEAEYLRLPVAAWERHIRFIGKEAKP